MTDDDAGASPTTGAARRSSSRDDVETQEHGVPGRMAAIAGAVAGGVVVGVFGTLLHAQLLTVGRVQLPLGAMAALLLAGSLLLCCGLWARNIFMTALAGGVAYGVVALMSMSAKTVILTGSSDAAPVVALAGNVWLFGVLGVTLVAVAAGAAFLRPRPREHERGY